MNALDSAYGARQPSSTATLAGVAIAPALNATSSTDSACERRPSKRALTSADTVVIAKPSPSPISAKPATTPTGPPASSAEACPARETASPRRSSALVPTRSAAPDAVRDATAKASA